jgi:hypothetical protein
MLNEIQAQIHSAHIGLLEYMDTTKYEVREIAKAAFEKHLLVSAYPNLSTLRVSI